MDESQRREESYVQDGDRQLLRCICNEVLGPLVEVSVQKADKKYACTVETDECCVKVSGVSDVVLKAGKIRPLIWECKRQSYSSFQGLQYRQTCFAILSAVRAYRGNFSVNPRRLCGILSSGKMFVLIQATRDDASSLEMKWERTQMVNLFDTFGQSDSAKHDELIDMISHALVVAREISRGGEALTSIERDDVDSNNSTNYREEEDEAEDKKEEHGSESPRAERSSARTVSKSAKQGKGGECNVRGGKKKSYRQALLDIPIASLTCENVERNRRWRLEEEDRFKLPVREFKNYE